MDRLLYSEKLRLALNQQRQNGWFCDIAVLLMDCECYVHRCILATCSSSLEQELIRMQLEGRHRFDLRMITMTVFQVFVNYLYSGELVITSLEIAYDILKLAKYFNAKELEQICTSHILASSATSSSEIDNLNDVAFNDNTSEICHSANVATAKQGYVMDATHIMKRSSQSDLYVNNTFELPPFLIERHENVLASASEPLPSTEMRLSNQISQSIDVTNHQDSEIQTVSNNYNFDFHVSNAQFNISNEFNNSQSSLTASLPVANSFITDPPSVINGVNSQQNLIVCSPDGQKQFSNEEWPGANNLIRNSGIQANLHNNIYNANILENQFALDRQPLAVSKFDEQFIQLYLGSNFVVGDSQPPCTEQISNPSYIRHGNLINRMPNSDQPLAEFDMIAAKPFAENTPYQPPLAIGGKSFNEVTNIGDDTCSLDLLQDLVSVSCTSNGQSLLGAIATQHSCDVQSSQNLVSSPSSPQDSANDFPELPAPDFSLPETLPSFEPTHVDNLLSLQSKMHHSSMHTSANVGQNDTVASDQQVNDLNSNDIDKEILKDGKQTTVPLKKRLHILSRLCNLDSQLSQEVISAAGDASPSISTSAHATSSVSQSIIINSLSSVISSSAEKTFKCNLCAEEYYQAKVFKVHMLELHKEKRPFACNAFNCNFRSEKYSKLQKHVDIHSSNKMYPCPRCGKKFAQQKGIDSHLKSCGESRSHECNICKERFNYAAALKVHYRYHTGEKPYACSKCQATFADSSNFKRHLRIHENTCPYPCHLCAKKFRHSNTLKAHFAACHSKG